MDILAGPFLLFVSSDDATWRCRAVYVFQNVTAAPPPVRQSERGPERAVAGTKIFANGANEVWAYDLVFGREAADQSRQYNLDSQAPSTVIVPGVGTSLNLAYGSCCGFNDWRDKPKLEDQKKDPWGLWKDLLNQHASRPFHLLLLGGDQVYVESLWERGVMREWKDKLRSRQGATPWTPGGLYDQEVRAAFMDIYLSNWGRRPMADVLASIPSIMMWDDHDICDGWGSHPDDVQAFPVMQGLFGVARDYFQAFQLGRAPGSPPPAEVLGPADQFSSLQLLGDLAVLVLDLRSRRRRNRVLFSAKEWEDFFQVVKGRLLSMGKSTPKHLIVMSSVPVVYVSGPSDLAGLVPWDPVSDPQDDLIDQWSDYRHVHEREAFVRALLKLGRERDVRVTLVCGDIHVATLALIESRREEDLGSNARMINQLTSSGVVNLPPGAFELWSIQQLLDDPQNICRDVVGETVPLKDGWPRLIAARNWLSIRPAESPTGSLLAEWHVEGCETCPPKIITPV